MKWPKGSQSEHSDRPQSRPFLLPRYLVAFPPPTHLKTRRNGNTKKATGRRTVISGTTKTGMFTAAFRRSRLRKTLKYCPGLVNHYNRAHPNEIKHARYTLRLAAVSGSIASDNPFLRPYTFQYNVHTN
jgi:hypothetical protein